MYGPRTFPVITFTGPTLPLHTSKHFGCMPDTEELCSTKLRLWSRLVTGHQLFGTRFSEGVDAVKDMTEDEISHASDKLLKDTAESVKKDIAAGIYVGGIYLGVGIDVY